MNVRPVCILATDFKSHRWAELSKQIIIEQNIKQSYWMRAAVPHFRDLAGKQYYSDPGRIVPDFVCTTVDDTSRSIAPG